MSVTDEIKKAIAEAGITGTDLGYGYVTGTLAQAQFTAPAKRTVVTMWVDLEGDKPLVSLEIETAVFALKHAAKVTSYIAAVVELASKIDAMREETKDVA